MLNQNKKKKSTVSPEFFPQTLAYPLEYFITSSLRSNSALKILNKIFVFKNTE